MTMHFDELEAALSRRGLLVRGLVAGAALFTVRGAFADELAATPRVTEGPYYPDRMPLDTDNDLIVVNDRLTPAVGEITYLGGQVLTRAGSPVRNATVEIWQVDGKGAYLNTTDPNHARYDTNFQGYGRFLTDADGRYWFRTIKPIPYTGRAPHIHMAICQNGKRILTTQVLVRGHPDNARDGVLNGVRDPQARDSIQVDFAPLPGSRLGELRAQFDVVLGVTPEAPDEPVHGGIAPKEGDRGGPGGPGGPGGFGGRRGRGPGGPGRPPEQREPGRFF